MLPGRWDYTCTTLFFLDATFSALRHPDRVTEWPTDQHQWCTTKLVQYNPMCNPLQVLTPGTETWQSHRLPGRLPQSGIRVGASGIAVGLVDGNSRLLVCGGRDAIRQLQATCYYLQKNGTAIGIGAAPSFHVGRSEACHTSDGEGLVLVGGNT